MSDLLTTRNIDSGYTKAVMTVDYAHHEIHSGGHYVYTDINSMASDATQSFLLTTPNTTTWCHVLFGMDGSTITQFQIYESADRDGVTTQTVFNSNRNSVNTAGMTIHKGLTSGTTDGTAIYQYKGGAAAGVSKMGSGTRNDEEIVLKQGTKYIVRFTSGAGGNLTNLNVSWYEHANA